MEKYEKKTTAFPSTHMSTLIKSSSMKLCVCVLLFLFCDSKRKLLPTKKVNADWNDELIYLNNAHMVIKNDNAIFAKHDCNNNHNNTNNRRRMNEEKKKVPLRKLHDSLIINYFVYADEFWFSHDVQAHILQDESHGTARHKFQTKMMAEKTTTKQWRNKKHTQKTKKHTSNENA